jgi:radical SAM superfamily enzyme YgiQ (UPF0313 family)
MAKVALVNLSSLKMPGNDPIFPLGLERIRQVLQDDGHDVRIIDFRRNPDWQVNPTWLDEGWDVIGLTIRNIDPIDLSCESHVPHYLKYTQTLMQRARSRPLWVGGGPGFSLFAKDLTENMNLDVGVVGPGETRMRQLAADFSQYIGAGPTVLSGVADPEFDKRIMKYDANLMRVYAGQHEAMIGVETRRKSCYQGCTYCPYAHITGNDDGDVRTVESIISEIEGIYDSGIRRIFFTDGIFNADLRHAKRVIAALKKRQLPALKWSAYFTPKPFDTEIAELLVDSGVDAVVVSPDSLDIQMMNELGKSFDTRHVLKFLELCRNYELSPKVNVVIGGPNESEQTTKNSIKFINENLRDDELVLHIGYRVLPETAMSEQTQTSAEELLEPTFLQLDPQVFTWIYDQLDSRFLTTELMLNIAAAKSQLKHRKTVAPQFSVARKKKLTLPVISR